MFEMLMFQSPSFRWNWQPQLGCAHAGQEQQSQARLRFQLSTILAYRPLQLTSVGSCPQKLDEPDGGRKTHPVDQGLQRRYPADVLASLADFGSASYVLAGGRWRSRALMRKSATSCRICVPAPKVR